jgi:hypothetical protein
MLPPANGFLAASGENRPDSTCVLGQPEEPMVAGCQKFWSKHVAAS